MASHRTPVDDDHALTLSGCAFPAPFTSFPTTNYLHLIQFISQSILIHPHLHPSFSPVSIAQNRNDQLQDTLSSSSSLPPSFHSTTTTTTAHTTDDRQWYPDSQMGTSFYDPAQVSGFGRQQPVNVWDPQFAGTGSQEGEYFSQQHQQQQTYQQPYIFEGSSTSQYSFPQQTHRQFQQQQPQQPPQQQPIISAPRGPARGAARVSAYYRQGDVEGQVSIGIPLSHQISALKVIIPVRILLT